MAVIRKKLRSSALLEALVSMTILLLMFGIVSAVFISVSSGNVGRKVILANEYAESFISDVQHRHDFNNRTLQMRDEFTVVAEFELSPLYTNIINANIKVSDTNADTLVRISYLFLKQ